MAQIVIYNNLPYSIPSTGELNWGVSLTAYLVALATGSLTLVGGSFPLGADVNFGPNFGVASPYFKSGNANSALTGVVRLTNTESVVWRNSNNTQDLPLYLNGNQLYFNGSPIGGGSASPLTTKGDLYGYALVDTRIPVGANGTVLTADSSSATGVSWLPGGGGGGGGSVTGFTFTNANGISGVVTSPTTTPTLTLSLGAITPTTVTASGAISASNFNGTFNGTFSGTSSGTNTGNQTITLTGDVTGSGTGTFATTLATVPIGKGGTGATSAVNAINNLMPNQAGNNGKVAYTDGTNISWQSVSGGTGVSSVSIVTTQGVTGSVSNPTTTPVVNVGLGNITPTSVAASGTVTGSNISGTTSGTNTGDQVINLTGDVTGTGTTSFATTLVNTTVTPGSYTRASITVDAKGRITAAASGSLQTITLTGAVTGSGTGTFATTIASTGVTPGTGYNNFDVNASGQVIAASTLGYITGNQTITLSGDATGSGTTSLPLTLATTGVAAGTYATPSSITVDAKGRVSSITAGTPGTVSSVSVVTANGVSGSVANPTTTPAITLTLGAITPSSVTTGSGTLTALTYIDGFVGGTNANVFGANSSVQYLAPAPTTTFTPTGTYSGQTYGTYYQDLSTNATIQRPISLALGASTGYNGIYIGPTTQNQVFKYQYILRNTSGGSITLTWTPFATGGGGSNTSAIVWNNGTAITTIAAGKTAIIDIVCVATGSRGAGSGTLTWAENFYATLVGNGYF